MVKRYIALGDLVNVEDNTDGIMGSEEVYLASDYDALAAVLREIAEDINVDWKTRKARRALGLPVDTEGKQT